MRSAAAAVAVACAALTAFAARGVVAATTYPLLGDTFSGAGAQDSHWLTAAASGQDNEVPANGLPCLTAGRDVKAQPIAGCSGQSSPASSADPSGTGALRLTDNRPYEAAMVVDSRAWRFDSALSVDFSFYMYANASAAKPAADGLSFFLADGAANINAPGANGGALGYAPIGTIPGLPGAYIGVGFDEFGNFTQPLTDGEGCTAPPAAQLPAPRVAIRGPGDGTSGYCLIASSSVLPGLLDAPSANHRTDDGVARHAHIDIDAPTAKHPRVRVFCDFGSGMVPLASAPLPPNPPASVTMGFAAGTGIFAAVHEVSNLHVTTIGAPPVVQLKQGSQLAFAVLPGAIALAVLAGAGLYGYRRSQRRR